MIDFKQLQYFIVCAETGSFSKAAQRLYTTQPNVSKTIKALEKEMDAALFRRGKNGIELTDKGRHVYEHAGKVMDEMDLLRDFSDAKADTWLRISCTPSSKLADLFVEFYEKNKASDLHYRVYSTSVTGVFQRVRDNKDDVGIVFLEEGKDASLEYILMRYHLQFIPLKQVTGTLFLGEAGDMETQLQNMRDGKKLRLIQSYYDEISRDADKKILDCEGREIGELDPVIITNSDYITERILKKTDLANISGGSILEGDHVIMNGRGLELQDNKVTFGFVCRKSENLTHWAAEFIRFMKEKI